MQTKLYKNILIEQREEILAKKVEFPDVETADPIDAATQITNNSFQSQLHAREGLYLVKINEALKRIEDGSYGECQDCGDPIDEKRLKARPTSELCITCKEDQEGRERQTVQGQRSASYAKINHLD